MGHTSFLGKTLKRTFINEWFVSTKTGESLIGRAKNITAILANEEFHRKQQLKILEQ
jgi:hypothetical protein